VARRLPRGQGPRLGAACAKAVRGYLRFWSKIRRTTWFRSSCAASRSRRRLGRARKNFDQAAADISKVGFAPRPSRLTVAADVPEQVVTGSGSRTSSEARQAQDAVSRGAGRTLMTAQEAAAVPSCRDALRQVLELEPGHVDATLDLADLPGGTAFATRPKRLLSACWSDAEGSQPAAQVRFDNSGRALDSGTIVQPDQQREGEGSTHAFTSGQTNRVRSISRS